MDINLKYDIDWSKAPAWAQWCAMDSDGSWFWYQNEPVYHEEDERHIFLPDAHSKVEPFENGVISGWERSLMSKPE